MQLAYPGKGSARFNERKIYFRLVQMGGKILVEKAPAKMVFLCATSSAPRIYDHSRAAAITRLALAANRLAKVDNCTEGSRLEKLPVQR